MQLHQLHTVQGRAPDLTCTVVKQIITPRHTQSPIQNCNSVRFVSTHLPFQAEYMLVSSEQLV